MGEGYLGVLHALAVLEEARAEVRRHGHHLVLGEQARDFACPAGKNSRSRRGKTEKPRIIRENRAAVTYLRQMHHAPQIRVRYTDTVRDRNVH